MFLSKSMAQPPPLPDRLSPPNVAREAVLTRKAVGEYCNQGNRLPVGTGCRDGRYARRRREGCRRTQHQYGSRGRSMPVWVGVLIAGSSRNGGRIGIGGGDYLSARVIH